MSQYNTSQLGKKDIELYHDICNGNGVIAQLTHLTERQIGLLISMRNIIAPYTEIQTRTRFWKVLGKTKHGGHLTQAFSRTFFFGEN